MCVGVEELRAEKGGRMDQGMTKVGTLKNLTGPGGKHIELCDQELKLPILLVLMKPFKM